MKERAMAIFIGLVMVLSAAGFAAISASHIGPQQQQTSQIPTILNRTLTQEEKVTILRTGRVLIEDLYYPDCSECLANNRILEAFANRFRQFIVLEKVAVMPGNETNATGGYIKLQMIGSGGEIQDLEGQNITEENLLNVFCDIAIAQPTECLLMEI